MTTITYIIIAVVVVLVILAVILAPIFARRQRSGRFHDKYGTEYDHTVKTMGNEKKAQTELNERREHVEALNIRQLSPRERDRYLAAWNAVQVKFVDQPGQATV